MSSPLSCRSLSTTAREAREPIIPEYLHLADGRRVRTADISNRIENRQNGRRTHSGRIAWTQPRTTPAATQEGRSRQLGMPLKYSVEDRIWQYQHSLSAVARRWNLTLKQAQAIKYQVRYMARGCPDLFTGAEG